MIKSINFLARENLNAIKKAKSALKFKYSINPYTITENDTEGLKSAEIVEAVSMNITINSTEIDLIVAFRKNFPYTFPKVYLHPEVPDNFKHLPHVDRNLFICTFDEVEACPNFLIPREVVLKTVEKAINILENGFSNVNSTYFNQEFLAYWDLDIKSDNPEILSIFSPDNSMKLLTLLRLEREWKGFKFLLADNSIEAIEFIKKTSYSGKYNRDKALYLPLNDLGCPPYPNSNHELYERLKDLNFDREGSFLEFLSKNQRPSLIVFSLMIDSKYLLGAWEHKPYVFMHQKGKKNISGVPGFRKGKLPPQLELTNYAKNNEIKRYSVVRIDKERLFKRTKGELVVSQDYNISLLGCGSIGSYLLDNLVKEGFNNFTLIDNDTLYTENICRHICGLDYIKMKKVDALKKYYELNYPYLDVRTHPEKIETVLLDDQSFLDDYDLNIVCIGSISSEFMLNKLLNQGIIKKPLLIVWVEAYLMSGHACLLIPNKEGCLSCLFDKTYTFKYSYFKDINFAKRETGCQSTYVPYGASDIQLFTNMLSRFIVDFYNGKYTSNLVYSWLGDLTKIQLDPSNINSIWEGKNSFSIYTNLIEPINDCMYCKK